MKLTALIQKEIQNAGGQIDFARFMELALYAPELGYYQANTHKLGRAGDFVTAPEISPLFAKCLVKPFQQVLKTLKNSDILEFGAGSGIFAKDLLGELEKANALPEHYYILEVSAELRDQQLKRFQQECPAFLSRIIWLDALPDSFNGIIFANEVLDAMPVHRFFWDQGELYECGVAVENNQFVWRNMPISTELRKRVMAILEESPLPDGYRSEISLVQPAWIHQLAQILQQGVVWLVDYGYGRREYYHPERVDGTLMCFHQHRRHDNPFNMIGLQDITAHVDFTTIAESADHAGLNVAGFTTQAAFLLDCGLLEIAQTENPVETIQNNQAIKTLTLPAEMGEIVKVMALTKGFDDPLLGFALQDRRRDL